MKKTEFFDYQVFSDDFSDVFSKQYSVNEKKPLIINTINPHSYTVAKNDSLFHKSLTDSCILVPDGIGVVFAVKVLSRKEICRITGYEVFLNIMNYADDEGKRVFFMGSSPEVLKNISDRIKIGFPNVTVGSYSPPYKNAFSESENNSIINSINDFSADILFVGMTAPKQEKWVFNNKGKLNVRAVASIGAVFDFYAGTTKRPSGIWLKLGLEWLARLIFEPVRLWRRTFISGPVFILDVIVRKYQLFRTGNKS